MKIAGWDTYRYQLRLRRPLLLRGETLNLRAGLLIRLTDESGAGAWGEIAPLPGFSRETFDEVQFAVKRARYRLLNRTVPANLEELSGGFQRWLHDVPMPPSVQCGFETALLSLQARVLGQYPAQLLSYSPLADVSVNGLISAQRVELDREIERVTIGEYRAVKLKVGREDIDDVVDSITRVRTALPNDVALRLDANRAWTFEQALAVAEKIREFEIEYLEEPLDEPERLAEFAEKSGLPLALDETLAGIAPESLTPFDGLKTVIVRPMLLGGLEQSMRLARRAHQFGLTVVLSSAVESIVGIGALANLAAAMNTVDVPVGLDTLSWFADQPTEPFALKSKSRLPVADIFDASQNVVVSKLKRINHD